jgi:hypothetical protein
MERHKEEDRVKLKWLRGAVQDGLEEIDRGEGMEFRSADELDRHIDRLGEEVSAGASGEGKRA